MKIVLINTYETQGGAAIASKRLLTALNKTNEVQARLLVNIGQTNDPAVTKIADSKFKTFIRKYRFILEKVLFMPFEISKKERFSFSTAILGDNIGKHALVKEADILHIHWTNHSFLSHKNIRQLIRLNKPIVVTMHDMWYFTGGCHYSGDCTRFMSECGNCKYLKRPGNNDLSHKGWSKKKEMYTHAITFVGCSNWITEVAKSSSLLRNNNVLNIPNPIDTRIFSPKDRSEARKSFNLPLDKTLILYVAAKVDDERKGYKYLSEALLNLFESDTAFRNTIEIVVMGNVKNPEEINFHFPTHFVGSLSKPETIVSCYSAADVFVAPSLEDNLPNTIIESMACGTPVVAFRTGGIPEIIDHKTNGYLADYKSTEDLINGISWAVSQSGMSEKCIEKVENTFSEKVVSKAFIELYRSLL